MRTPADTLSYLGIIGVLLLLLAASIAIWKWTERYRTNMARVAAVLMIVGVWIGVGVRIGLILALLGLILMLVARSAFLRTHHHGA
jgi:O-antigen ligase